MAARGSDAMDDDYCEEVYSVEDDSAVEEEEEEEFVYEGEDDEDGPVMPPMPKLRRAVSHDFDVLDSDGLKQSMEEELSRAVETLGVPFSVACALLRHFAWNFGRMAEAYCEDSEKVLKAAHCESLMEAANAVVPVVGPAAGPALMSCEVCADAEVPAWNFTALPCGHAFCNDCWSSHITSKVNEGQALGIRCMDSTCWELVGEAVIVALCPPPVIKKWKDFVVKSFADENPTIKWCPRAGCTMAVRFLAGVPKNHSVPVECVCGTKFCFGCAGEPHAPALCSELKDWNKVSSEESATALWLTANTKDCPKCKVAIEKNQGCQHMTCRNCRHEFCWLCMGNWRGHAACNSYEEKSSSRESIERYLFYSTRYHAHAASQKLESQLKSRAEATIARITARAPEAAALSTATTMAVTSSEDLQFVAKCTDTLIDSRGFLKWTYVSAYFMRDPVEKRLFEFRQQELEEVTESLSRELEKPPKAVFAARRAIMTLADNCRRRIEVLMEGYEMGFAASVGAADVSNELPIGLAVAAALGGPTPAAPKPSATAVKLNNIKRRK